MRRAGAETSAPTSTNYPPDCFCNQPKQGDTGGKEPARRLKPRSPGCLGPHTTTPSRYSAGSGRAAWSLAAPSQLPAAGSSHSSTQDSSAARLKLGCEARNSLAARPPGLHRSGRTGPEADEAVAEPGHPGLLLQ